MKKIVGITASAIIAACAFYSMFHPSPSREDYETFLRTHKYTLDLAKGKPAAKAVKDKDRPDLAFMQDYLRTMDPRLRRPMPEVLHEQNRRTARLRDINGRMAMARSKSTTLHDGTVWEERGPSIVGGRTRALLFDPADPQSKKVWAGGVSGGLWYNDDITSNTAWTKVDDFWDNLSISCITADPNNNQILYVGTGEAHTSMRGGGIWKTTNGGDTWSVLPATIEFVHIRDIKIRNENGTSVVYAAVNQDFGLDNPPDNAGLYRSANGGVSWTQVLPVIQFGAPHTPTDIEFGDDEIWVGTKPTYNNTVQNSIIYRSTTGTGGWTAESLNTRGQVELTVAPSNPNVVYAILEEGNAVEAIMKTINNGADWTSVNEPEDIDTGIPADDFTRGQAWYDLTIAVHPTNPDNVIIGGIDLFKSTNGGTSWVQLTVWDSFFSATLPTVHADQHEILYRPGFPNEAIFGNDGGVYYGTNLNTATPTFAARNNNYNVTQFYTAAIHPLLPNYMLGGTQDNGTQKFTLPGFGTTSEAYGGDGALCFIDQKNPQVQIVSYVYNDVSLSVNGGVTFNTKLLDDPNSGNFINVGEYDSNLKILYTAKSDTEIYRVRTITTTPSKGTIDIPGLGSMVSAMRLSPHVSNSSNLYVGTSAGRVFKIANAQATTPDISEITGPDFPNGSVSGIAFGEDEDQILVTFFNYGVVSIWETRNGGDTWVDREGDLPNMPVRWVDYHPNNPDQAYIATELGVWSTENINVADPVWLSTNGGLANVRTDMLRIRESDGVMMAATYGRGIFTALIPSQIEQTITFNALTDKTFSSDVSFDLNASATSGLDVSFVSSDPAIASIENKTVTIHNAGTVTITANQDGNIHFKSADPVPQTLIINKAVQTISFDAFTEKKINDEPFSLTAVSDSDLTVSYTSSNTAVATVAGNVVTIKGTGSTNITARQAGNNNYLAATDVMRQLTVVSKIIVLSGDLNFGEVIIKEPDSRVLTIENTGTAPITVSGITYPAGFSGITNVTGEQILVTITFNPTESKEYTGNIVVTSDATSGVNTIGVSGTGIFITGAEQQPDRLLIVYPNPTSDWLTISGNNLKQVRTVDLTDESGKVYSQDVFSQSETEIKMKVAGLPGGVYIIAILIENKVQFKKFTKN
jgi:photosystem II stability/assembly factor-like uncharacterized protein